MSTLSTPTPAPSPAGFAGTWDIDPAHTEVGFSVRHLMVSRLRGRFGTFSGTFTIGADADAEGSSVAVTVDLASIDTNHADRDAHLRSADFFSVDQHPTMTYRSTAVRPEGDDWAVEGELTLNGVSRPVVLTVEALGMLPQSPFGDTRIGFSASAAIDRRDFGIEWNAAVEGGGVVVGHQVSITLEVEGVLRPA